MPELSFSIASARVLSGVESLIGLSVRITATPPETHVYSLSLQYDVQIDAVRRHYTADEQQRLISLFGPIGNWHRTLSSLSWTSGTAQVPAFIGETVVELPLACGGELHPAMKRYLKSLAGGEALLVASFSGTGFSTSDTAPLQILRIPWDRLAMFRLPVNVWREALEGVGQKQAAMHFV